MSGILAETCAWSLALRSGSARESSDLRVPVTLASPLFRSLKIRQKHPACPRE